MTRRCPLLLKVRCGIFSPATAHVTVPLRQCTTTIGKARHTERNLNHPQCPPPPDSLTIHDLPWGRTRRTHFFPTVLGLPMKTEKTLGKLDRLLHIFLLRQHRVRKGPHTVPRSRIHLAGPTHSGVATAGTCCVQYGGGSWSSTLAYYHRGDRTIDQIYPMVVKLHPHFHRASVKAH